MLRVGQGLDQLGAAQGCLGIVLELQDPPLPQARLVAGDDLGDGDGVEESESAQQPAGEPGGVPPDLLVDERLPFGVPLLS
jgi:hypothetical protein